MNVFMCVYYYNIVYILTNEEQTNKQTNSYKPKKIKHTK